MSRSNTNYHNVCRIRDGECASWYHARVGRHIPERTWETRRGIVVRKKRFPNHSWKSWCSGPPSSIRKQWRRQIRAKYADLMRRDQDLVLFDAQKWSSGQYQYWS